MGYCDGLILADIEPDCESPLVMGIEQEGVIINRSSINWGTAANVTDGVIDALPLLTGQRGYKVVVPTKNPFTGTGVTLAEGTSRNSFASTVGIVILDDGPDVSSKVIDGLTNGEYIVVLQNKHKGVLPAGKSAFQVYGYSQGLRATEISKDKYSADTEGGWNIVLTEDRSPNSSIYLWDTSYEATQTIFNSLTTVVGG